MKSRDNTCKTCIWWDTDYYWNRWYVDAKGNERLYEDDNRRVQGLCRVNSPGEDKYNMQKGFPVTWHYDWCGRYEVKN